MNITPLSSRPCARSLKTAALLLACTGAAYATDTYELNTSVLAIPSLAIGSATYSTVAITGLTLANVVAIDNNGTPNGSEDGYVPATALLTIPVQGSDGNLYGTTVDGDAVLGGTVFKVTNAISTH